ncbi:MAG: hypothetical protein U0S12_14920 [Fimbriimonadales bacterium]
MTLRATTVADIPAVIDLVHDLWFDVDDLQAKDGEIELRIFDRGKGETSVGLLRIGNVRSVTLRDTERIGFYDINELLYDGTRLQITTGVPLYLSIDVSSLDLYFESFRYSGAVMSQAPASSRTTRLLLVVAFCFLIVLLNAFIARPLTNSSLGIAIGGAAVGYAGCLYFALVRMRAEGQSVTLFQTNMLNALAFAEFPALLGVFLAGTPYSYIFAAASVALILAVILPASLARQD